MTITVPIHKLGELLLVSIQDELNDRVAMDLQKQILRLIQKSKASALLIDISSLELIDSYVGRVLRDTATMARLMNTKVAIVGMQPAIAMTMVEMGLGLADINTCSSLDGGLLSLGYRLEKVDPQALVNSVDGDIQQVVGVEDA